MGIAILGAFLQTTLADNVTKSVDGISGLPEQAKVVIIDGIKSQGLGDDSSKIQEELKNQLMPTLSPEQVRAAAMDPAQALAMQKKFASIGAEVQAGVKQSFVDSINKTFKVSALIGLLGALVALLFRNSKRQKAVAKETAIA
jgi:hypothetical protein